jgi:Arc/MetJ family transcription regulator
MTVVYDSLATQINAMKTKMTSMTNSATTTQDMIYLAKSMTELANMLGVDDIVAATAAKITELETKRTTSIASLETARVASLADIGLDRATALADISTARVSAINQVSGAGASLHSFFMVGV